MTWWSLGQTLIWIATRSEEWVAALVPRRSIIGTWEQRGPFGEDLAAALIEGHTLERYREGAELLYSDFIDAIATGRLTAVENGQELQALEFVGALVGDGYIGSTRTDFLSIYRAEALRSGRLITYDAPYWRPFFRDDQVRETYPSHEVEPPKAGAHEAEVVFQQPQPGHTPPRTKRGAAMIDDEPFLKLMAEMIEQGMTANAASNVIVAEHSRDMAGRSDEAKSSRLRAKHRERNRLGGNVVG